VTRAGTCWQPYGQSWPRLLLKWSSCSRFAVIQPGLKGTSTAVRRNCRHREPLDGLLQAQPQRLCIGDRCLAGKGAPWSGRVADVGCGFGLHEPSIPQQRRSPAAAKGRRPVLGATSAQHTGRFGRGSQHQAVPGRKYLGNAKGIAWQLALAPTARRVRPAWAIARE
jgi:hypothetical protein